MTALPVNSACASPYSFRIFDARRFTDGIARPCSAEPSLAQRRGWSQRSAAGMIDGDCSNSRSRSIAFQISPVVPALVSATRAFSRRSLERWRGCVCVVNVNTVGHNAISFGSESASSGHLAPRPSCLRARPTISEWNRRPPLLAIRASACFDNSGSLVATFGYPATCAGLLPASGGLMSSKPLA